MGLKPPVKPNAAQKGFPSWELLHEHQQKEQQGRGWQKEHFPKLQVKGAWNRPGQKGRTCPTNQGEKGLRSSAEGQFSHFIDLLSLSFAASFPGSGARTLETTYFGAEGNPDL